MKSKWAVVDIETTGLNRFQHEITWVGISAHKSLNPEPDEVFTYNMSQKIDRRACLNKLIELRDDGVKFILQNGKFDALFLAWKYGVKLPIHEDIMLMGTAYDLAAKHGLKPMAMRYLGVEDWDIPKKDKTSSKSEKVEPYLRLDLRYTWQLFVYFVKKLTKRQKKIYKKLLFPAYQMYRDVEEYGIYFDINEYQLIQKKYKDIEVELLTQLNAKYPINWNSPQQKQQVLFLDEQGEKLPILKTTPKGAPCGDAKVMKRLAAEGYEIPKLLLKYSGVNTLNRMFLNRWGIDASYDGRIHPSFKLTGVVSGRTSCTDPNLQQVPRTKDVRALFTAEKGKIFFEADYSQLELRIAAHYAQEPTMMKIYQEGGDIHTETARVMTGGREPTKDERGKAKAVNFGFLYGMGVKKFVEYAYDSYGQVFSLAEAEAYRNAFFAKYNRLLPWHKKQEIICESEGGVANLFGRFRKLPDIYSDKYFERLGAIRQAINTPVQGTGSDILLSSAVEIHKELSPYGLRICGTIHDAIVGEVYEKDVDWIVPEIQRIMAHPKLMDEFGVELTVPLEADVGLGPWGSK